MISYDRLSMTRHSSALHSVMSRVPGPHRMAQTDFFCHVLIFQLEKYMVYMENASIHRAISHFFIIYTTDHGNDDQ